MSAYWHWFVAHPPGGQYFALANNVGSPGAIWLPILPSQLWMSLGNSFRGKKAFSSSPGNPPLPVDDFSLWRLLYPYPVTAWRSACGPVPGVVAAQVVASARSICPHVAECSGKDLATHSYQFFYIAASTLYFCDSLTVFMYIREWLCCWLLLNTFFLTETRVENCGYIEWNFRNTFSWTLYLT